MVPQQQWYIDLNTSALHYYDTEKLGTFDLFVQKSHQYIGVYFVIFGKMHQNQGCVFGRLSSKVSREKVKYWSNTGSSLVKYWSNSGQILDPRWSNTGQIPIKYWNLVGQILVKF